MHLAFFLIVLEINERKQNVLIHRYKQPQEFPVAHKSRARVTAARRDRLRRGDGKSRCVRRTMRSLACQRETLPADVTLGLICLWIYVLPRTLNITRHRGETHLCLSVGLLIFRRGWTQAAPDSETARSKATLQCLYIYFAAALRYMETRQSVPRNMCSTRSRKSGSIRACRTATSVSRNG